MPAQRERLEMMRAPIRLAQPFPPVPPELMALAKSRTVETAQGTMNYRGVRIAAAFNYVLDTQKGSQ